MNHRFCLFVFSAVFIFTHPVKTLQASSFARAILPAVLSEGVSHSAFTKYQTTNTTNNTSTTRRTLPATDRIFREVFLLQSSFCKSSRISISNPHSAARPAYNLDNLLGNRGLAQPIHSEAQLSIRSSAFLVAASVRGHARGHVPRGRFQQRVKYLGRYVAGHQARKSCAGAGRRCSPRRRCRISSLPLPRPRLQVLDAHTRGAGSPCRASFCSSVISSAAVISCDPSLRMAAAFPLPGAAKSPT